MCKTKMAACALRIKCCVLESCCSFDGSFPSRSTNAIICMMFGFYFSLLFNPNVATTQPIFQIREESDKEEGSTVLCITSTCL